MFSVNNIISYFISFCHFSLVLESKKGYIVKIFFGAKSHVMSHELPPQERQDLPTVDQLNEVNKLLVQLALSDNAVRTREKVVDGDIVRPKAHFFLPKGYQELCDQFDGVDFLASQRIVGTVRPTQEAGLRGRSMRIRNSFWNFQQWSNPEGSKVINGQLGKHIVYMFAWNKRGVIDARTQVYTSYIEPSVLQIFESPKEKENILAQWVVHGIEGEQPRFSAESSLLTTVGCEQLIQDIGHFAQTRARLL
jgi:hypothetical protein